MTTGQPTHREVVESTAETEATMRPQRVPINMYETSGALVVVAPFCAVQPADVTVELNGDRLRFWARVRSSGPREHLVQEWEYGGYEREVDLPPGYGSGVEATLANGQLAIRVFPGAPAGSMTVQPTVPSA